MGFLDDLIGGKVNKEAEILQGENAQDHADKKLKASNWINDAMSLDEVQVEAEYQAKLAEEARLLGKTAALDDVTADTIAPDELLKKDYEREVKILSDYALAEMLAEYRGHKEQNTPEMFSEHKEKAKKEVASSREKAEKALLNMIGEHTSLDWKKAFETFSKDAKVEHPTEKDLYQPIAPEKKFDFEHPTEEKFKVPSDERKVDVMIGVGREADERTDVTQEAGVLQADITKGLGKEASVEKKADAYQPKTGEPCHCRPGMERDNCSACEGTGQKIDFKKIREKTAKSPHDQNTNNPDKSNMTEEEHLMWDARRAHEFGRNRPSLEEVTKRRHENNEKLMHPGTASLETKADYQGWKNYETWAVALWLNNDQGLYQSVQEAASTITDQYKLADWISSFVEEMKPDLGATLWADLLNGAMSEVDWAEIAASEMQTHLESAAAPKVEKHAEPESPLKREMCPLCGGEGKDMENHEIACMACGISYGSQAKEAAPALSYPVAMEMTKEQLMDLPTLAQGHMDNLKFDDGKHRIWVSRMTREDGAPEDNQIHFETLQNGRWVEASKNVPIKKMAHQAWDVYLNGKHIDTVFGYPTDTVEEVKRSLVNHDGYDGNIVVRKVKMKKAEEIKSHASKADVLKKVAEVQSPWAVVVDEKGQECIARVNSTGTTKESEEDTEGDLLK